MIRLQTPIIKETIHPKKTPTALNWLYPEKIIHNISSKALIDNIYNENYQHILVGLISLIEPWVYLHTNLKLIDNGHLPLIDDETIILISSGEYMIDYYYRIEVNKYGKQTDLFDKLLQSVNNSNKDFFDKYKNYFKISGIDFDLNINTSNTNRFEIIEKYVIESLVEILDKITDGLDAIYNYDNQRDVLLPIFNNNYNNDNVESIDIDYDLDLLKKVKTIMANPTFKFDKDLMFHPTKSLIMEARETNYRVFNDFGSQIDAIMNNSNNIMIFPYAYFLIKNVHGKNDYPNSSHKKFDNIIINQLNQYFIELSNGEIYSNYHKNAFFVDSINGFRSINHDLYLKRFNDFVPEENNNNAFYDIIKFPNITQVNNMEIIPSDSFYIYNQGKEVIDSIVEKKHNIVVNQSKAKATRSNTYIIDKDTIELNLSVVFKGLLFNNKPVVYPISSNIVTFEIERINSTNYVDNVNVPYQVLQIKNPKVTIKTYDRKTLINKLMKKLFDEDHFLPWYIPNYNQNIVKLLFLINLDKHEYIDFLKKLLQTQNKKELVDYSLYYCFDYQSYSFYNLIWIDPMTVDRYYEIQYLIKFIIIMDNILLLPDATLRKILIDFNSSYGWYDPNVDLSSVKVSYQNFKNNLLNTLNELDDIYHNKSK